MLPTTLTSIPNSAFEGCTNLGYIDGLENVKTVGEKAFKDVLSENTINMIPLKLNSATSIDAYAFANVGNVMLFLLAEGDITVTKALENEEGKTSSEKIGLCLNSSKRNEVSGDGNKVWQGCTFSGISF